jgi:peptidoglycan hydrolase CwlO-like protein
VKDYVFIRGFMFTLDYTTVEQDRVLDLIRKTLPPRELDLLDDLLIALDKKIEAMDIRIDNLMRERCNLRDDLVKTAAIMESLRHDITKLEFAQAAEGSFDD